MGINELLKPKDKTEELDYKIETLALSVQIAIQKSMAANCVAQKELASRLGVSPARVSQILSGSGANLTLKTIAKIAHVLGDDFELLTKQEAKQVLQQNEAQQYESVRKVARTPRRDPWRDYTANLNRYPDQRVA